MISTKGEIGAGGFILVHDLTPQPKVQFDGSCFIKCLNGDTFNGEMVRGRRDGNGRIVWADGGEFKGNFEDDEISGFGEISFPNGETYKGNFVEGAKSGQGKFVL